MKMESNHLRRDRLLWVRNLTVAYPLRGRTNIHAVSDLSFDIGYGETLGLVGESGCGKSTLAKTLVGLQQPSGGIIHYHPDHIPKPQDGSSHRTRAGIQMIFQDAAASLNPGRTIGKSIEAPLHLQKKVSRNERRNKTRDMMQTVGLDPDQLYSRYPSEASGGQCQRASLARALMTTPKFLVCDEPVSSLDVSVQAQILNLLEEMKRRFNLTMLFISHDLAVIKNISDRVAVMYLGRLCEMASAESLYRAPHHPYTRTLLGAIPQPDPDRPIGEQNSNAPEMPSASTPPSGCRFHPRCPRAESICEKAQPDVTGSHENRWVACHFPHTD